MSLRPRSDFWQAGILPVPIRSLLDPTALSALRQQVVWLPDPGTWRYLADPFGVQRGNATHVFVEAFDYRTKHAVIEHHEFGPGLVWRQKTTALARPFHLSYPYLVEQDGEVFMIPESQRNNEVALYRARQFPDDWVRETALLPGLPGAEASVLQHEGRWWMFFTLVGPQARDQRELHAAYADRLTGPWKTCDQNPILVDRAGARPGGTPFVGPDGRVVLPVQDCSATYGGALRFLHFTTLDPRHITVEHLPGRLTGDLISATHHDGLHTLSACGNLTLLDAKKIDRSWSRLAINARRRLSRLASS